MGAIPPPPNEPLILEKPAEALPPPSSKRRWSLAPGSRWDPRGVLLIIAALGGAGGVQTIVALVAKSGESEKLDKAVQSLEVVTARLEALEGKRKLGKKQDEVRNENLRLANEKRDERDVALAKALSRMNGMAFMPKAPKPDEDEEKRWQQALIPKDPLVKKGHYLPEPWPELPIPKPIPTSLEAEE